MVPLIWIFELQLMWLPVKKVHIYLPTVMWFFNSSVVFFNLFDESQDRPSDRAGWLHVRAIVRPGALSYASVRIDVHASCIVAFGYAGTHSVTTAVG